MTYPAEAYKSLFDFYELEKNNTFAFPHLDFSCHKPLDEFHWDTLEDENPENCSVLRGDWVQVYQRRPHFHFSENDHIVTSAPPVPSVVCYHLFLFV